MLNNLKVLYVEDEDFIRENIVEALTFMSVNVTAFENGTQAYEHFLKDTPDIIITDIEMPKCNGLELIEKIRKHNKNVKIMITTAYTNTEYFLKAVELNLLKYFIKPISLMELKDTLVKCSNLSKLEDNNKKYFNEEDFYDLDTDKLFINHCEIKLDFHERKLLKLLLKNSNQVVSYEEIEALIWKKDMTAAALRSLVRNLRQKLPENMIKNSQSLGYKVLVQ